MFCARTSWWQPCILLLIISQDSLRCGKTVPLPIYSCQEWEKVASLIETKFLIACVKLFFLGISVGWSAGFCLFVCFFNLYIYWDIPYFFMELTLVFYNIVHCKVYIIIWIPCNYSEILFPLNLYVEANRWWQVSPRGKKEKKEKWEFWM